MRNIIVHTIAIIASRFLIASTAKIDFESSEYYHPCVRPCERNVSMICEYHFNLEQYVTMGKGCLHCKNYTTRQQLYTFPKCQCVYGGGIERGVLTINRMIPGPSIHVCFRDTVIVKVHNMMEGYDTSIHWHGLHQRGSPYYDGVPFITQCPILDANSFKYRFKADKPGSHFYHSHSGSQKLDGLYGSFIVRLPADEDPHKNLYDEDLPEHTMIISDFMETLAADYFPGYSHSRIGQYPVTFLINGLGRYTNPKLAVTTPTPYEIFRVRRDVRYRFRIINSFATSCDAILTVENHSLTMIATDGDDFEPIEIDTLVSYSGERFDVILNANQMPGDYWIQVHSDECKITKAYQLAILRYEEDAMRSTTPSPDYDHPLQAGRIYNPDCALHSTSVCITDLRSISEMDEDIAKPVIDLHVDLPFELYYFNADKLYLEYSYKRYLVPPSTNELTGLLNGISFHFPPSPPLSQREATASLCFPRLNRLPSPCNKENCSCPYTLHVDLNDVLEILLIDISEQSNTQLTHPFHMHGHSFYVMDYGKIDQHVKVDEKTMQTVFKNFTVKMYSRNVTKSVLKDTIVIPHSGYAILRAKMNNPGYWFFHCHFVYHILVGMNLILQVGHERQLPPVPENFPRCGDFMPDY